MENEYNNIERHYSPKTYIVFDILAISIGITMVGTSIASLWILQNLNNDINKIINSVNEIQSSINFTKINSCITKICNII